MMSDILYSNIICVFVYIHVYRLIPTYQYSKRLLMSRYTTVTLILCLN